MSIWYAISSISEHFIPNSAFVLIIIHKKFWKTPGCYCNVLSASILIHSWEVLERRYVVAAIFSLLLLLDVTLIFKLLKFRYLIEDSEDLKSDADMFKVLTEDSEDFDINFVFLIFMLHQLFLISQWIWRWDKVDTWSNNT